jgi:hypothetical protein
MWRRHVDAFLGNICVLRICREPCARSATTKLCTWHYPRQGKQLPKDSLSITKLPMKLLGSLFNLRKSRVISTYERGAVRPRVSPRRQCRPRSKSKSACCGRGHVSLREPQPGLLPCQLLQRSRLSAAVLNRCVEPGRSRSGHERCEVHLAEDVFGLRHSRLESPVTYRALKSRQRRGGQIAIR